jgi:hypothetical protein
MAALPLPARSAHTFPIIEKAARRAARLWFTGTPFQTLYAWREDSCAYHCAGRPDPAAAGDVFRAEFAREMAAIIAGASHE